MLYANISRCLKGYDSSRVCRSRKYSPHLALSPRQSMSHTAPQQSLPSYRGAGSVLGLSSVATLSLTASHV